MKYIFLMVILSVSVLVCAQDHPIAQFAVWKPKSGKEQHFETGYKEHLLWHRNNGDTWNWYGWYVISGARYGHFVDATFGHSWSDFSASVNPAEDVADNKLHVYPFGDFVMAYKVALVKEASAGNQDGLKSKFLRMVTLTVNDMSAAVKVVSALRDRYEKKQIVQRFYTYKMVDGGDINQLTLLLGFNSWAEYGKTEGLQDDITEIERTLKGKVITSINSETLVYRADMSLNVE